MPPWGLAKKPVKLFLNFSFGQFLSQPLEDDQILITSNGIGCKDIYFNIDKLNALLSESGIPLVVCVAYISEVIICLPWSVEINGIDFVVQAISEVSTPSGTDELFNSMISSVTTAAFAVAKAANSSTIPTNLFEEGFVQTSEEGANVESTDKDKIPKGLQEQAYKFFENLTVAAETMSIGTKGASSYVDQDSKQRIAHMIDSLIAQTSIVLRDVSIRVECELRLPGLDRASGLTLSIKHLSISNQYKTEDRQPPPSQATGGRWSWLWWWQGSNNTNTTGKNSASSSSASPPPTTTSTPLGSLSTMLHKIIHVEEVNLFWDLWSTTSSQVRTRSSLSSSPDPSESSCSPLSNKKTCGPTADTMVSSAKLLTLSGSEHTARLSLRVGSALSGTPNFTPSSTVQSDDSMRSANINSMPSNSMNNNTNINNSNVSDFQLRLHVDLGPIVACAYPSQFYWLNMMFGQLVHIYEDYVEQRKSICEQNKLENDMKCYYSNLLTRNHLSNIIGGNDCVNVLTSNLDNHIHNYSDRNNFQKLHPTSPLELREAHLIDLDLSDNTRDAQNLTSTMLNSELFRSCLTDVSTTTLHDNSVTSSQFFDRQFIQKPEFNNNNTNRNSPQVTTKYTMSANILCVAFIAFYEDESVLTREQMVEGVSFSSSSVSSVHKLHSNEADELDELKKLSKEQEQPCDSDTSIQEHHHQQESDDFSEKSKGDSSSVNNPTGDYYSTIINSAAALPGPSIFFARFHGFIPTPNCQLKSIDDSNSNNSVENKDKIPFKCQPMRINREEVDTGRMSSAEWVAHLKYQFSNMAYPRDHLCFVGGLWHMEFSNNQLTVPSGGSQLMNTNRYTQLCFNIQLFGIHLSEGLFLERPRERKQDKNSELTIHDKILESFELFHFPHTSSHPPSSDRLSRSLSNEPAVKLNGTLYIPQGEPNPRSRIVSMNTQICQDFISELHIDVSHFCVDLDISIMDRIHRIADALAAASEAVARLSPLKPTDFSNHAEWYDTDLRNDGPVLTKSDHYHADYISGNKSSSTAYNIPRSSDYQSDSADLLKPYSSSINLSAKCYSFEFNLHFPVPLEAVKTDCGQKITEIRSKLWGTGDLHNVDQSNSIQNISWWRRTLRKEYLNVFMKKIRLTLNNNYKNVTLKSHYESNDPLQGGGSLPKSKLPSSIGTNHKNSGGNEQELELFVNSVSIHLVSDDDNKKMQSIPIVYFASKINPFPEPIKICIRIAPSGRTDLVECINENPMSKDFDDSTTTTTTASTATSATNREQPMHFEVGVDMAAQNEYNNTSNNNNNLSSGQSYEQSVEWSLWNQANPRQNCFIPLVIRRNFVQDAPKPHSKQITYYPGNKAHMSSYRQSASMHTHLFVHIKVPVAEITIENKQTVEILCLRLMYDLLLWQSLLPNDRRLRATLKRPGYYWSKPIDPGTSSQVDHRYWFLSDPAPLASIYAHPEAARAAAELEAISPLGYHNVYHPSGLHYHSVRSDDDDDGDDDEEDSDVIDDEMYNSNRHSTAVNDVNNCYKNYNGDNGKHAKWKNTWSSDLRRNFNNKAGLSSNLFSRQHTSNFNNTANTENIGPSTGTSVQYQSSICFQLDINSAQLTTFLPESPETCLRGEKVIVNATNTILFAEVAHNSNPNLNYFEMEVGEFDVSYSCNPNSNSDVHHNQSDGVNASDSLKNIWPVLCHLSWDSIGYPYGSSLHQVGVSSGNLSNEPTISLALEHRQIHHLSESGNSTYDDEFILSLRIQDVCFIYWPLFSLNNRWDIFSNIGNPTSTTSGSTNYTFYTTTNSTTSNSNSSSNINNFHNLIGLPTWFLRFCNLWQTPSMKQIAQEYSSYYAPDCLFNQHLHFEHLTMTFSMPYPEYFNLSTNKSSIVNYHQMMMPILHFMIGCESASITVNTAMEMLPMNPSTHRQSNTNTNNSSHNNNNSNRVDVQPGMLVMAFINNLATFIFPFKFTSASLSGNANSPNLRPSPSSSSDANHSPHPLLSEFRNWLNTLDLNKAVCVASLDHLEFRCFSEPVILPSTIDTTMYSNKSSPTIMNRFDMRITNNLLKINTCADSLVVLHKLVELFTITDSNCLSTHHHHHHHHLSPNVVKPSTSGTADSGVKQFYASSSSVSSPIHLHCSRNILDNKGKSGSGSSLDLIQDAVSDVESVPSSPYKTFIPKRSSAVDIPSNTSVHSPKKNDQLLRGIEYKSSSNDSSTPPQPCRTVHNNNTSGNDNHNIRRKSSNSTIDVNKSPSSNLTNSPTMNTPPTTDKYKTLPSVNKSRLYPDLSDHLKSISDDTLSNSQSSSLTDDFVFIDPSTVPALNYYSTPKEKIRCLLQPNVKSSNTTSDQLSFSNFDIHENFYSPPSSTTQSSKSHLVNQWNRLFTDPVKIYPRPLIAITLYDVSFEWNIYGGNDLMPLSSMLPGNTPVNEPSIPVRPQAKSTLSIASPLRDSSEILITPSHSSESLNNHKCMSNTRSAVSTTAINSLNNNNTGGNISSSPSQMTKLCPKPGYRFRHGRPVIQKPASVSNIGVNPAESNSEQVSLKLPASDAKKGIRSRQLLYSQGGSGRQLDNCISFNISKLYFRHAKFPPRMKKFINQHNQQQQQQSNSPQNLFNLTVDPYQRLIIHISNVVILDRVMNSNVNQLLYSYNKTYSTSTNLLPHNLNTPMLRMVVVCWPVVSHQIEQDSIIRPQQQQTEKKIATGEIEGEDDSSVDDADDDFRKEASNNSLQSSDSKVEYIYLPQPDNLEVEVKLSVQPLKINLDQYTLLFLYEYQENFKRYLTASSRESDNFQMGQSVSSLELKSSPTSVCTQYGQTINNINTVSGSPSQPHVNHPNDNITGTPQSNQINCARPVYSSIDLIESSQPVLFIRKVTFYPDLPIHLDYHGRRLDLSGGSFHGLLAMLLQLTNAEFTIPRRVYQRGYQSLDRLIEEVVEDISSILSSQLPHAIVTSLGPMHEVTQFLLGLWDLIYQPVCSLYGTAELPNTPLDPSHISTAVSKLGLFKKPHRILDDTRRSGEYLSSETSHNISRGGIIHGLRRGTRSFSTSTLWATLQLTIQGIRAVQSVAETAYDLVTPGPALRSRRLHLRQPADIREGFGNAVNVMTRGFQMVAEDLCGATVLPSEVEIGYKGPVGMVGDVLRQIPPTMVTPIVAGCEVTANILGGLRNQLRPEAKVEDEQKWKNTYGL